MIKYFDSSLFSFDQSKRLPYVRLDFNTFHQTILQTQKKLLQMEQQGSNIYIKSEPGVCDDPCSSSSNKTKLKIKEERTDDLPNNQTEHATILPDYCRNNDLFKEEEFMSDLGESEEQVSSNEDASPSESEGEASIYADEQQLEYSKTDKEEQKLERLKKSDENIARWKPLLACLMCSKACATLTILQEHFRQEHPLVDCWVICCSRRYRDRPTIERHMMQHLDSKRFKCNWCSLEFKNPITLRSHTKRHHSQHVQVKQKRRTIRKRNNNEESDKLIAQWKPNLECYVCKETRPTLTLLRQHFIGWHATKTLYVMCCNIKLKDRNKFEAHVKRHLDPNAHKCDICYKTFKTRFLLSTHMRRVHSDDTMLKEEKLKRLKGLRNMGNEYDDVLAQWKPSMKCHLCTESFSRFSVFEKHFRAVHCNEEFLIMCCEVKLNKRLKLLDHVRYHNDPNSFKCEICGNKYPTCCLLKNHKRKVHRKSSTVIIKTE